MTKHPLSDWNCDTEEESFIMYQIEVMARRTLASAEYMKKEYNLTFYPDRCNFLTLTIDKDLEVFFKYFYKYELYEPVNFMNHYAIDTSTFVELMDKYKARFCKGRTPIGQLKFHFIEDIIDAIEKSYYPVTRLNRGIV